MKKKYYYNSILIDGIEQDKQLYSIEHIDDQNQIIKLESIYDGHIVQIENGNFEDGKIAEKEISYLETETKTKFTYTYQNNLILTEKEVFNDGSFSLTSYSYNELDKLTSIIQTDEKSNIIQKILFNKTEAGKQVQYFNQNNNIIREEVITLNNKEQETEIVVSNYYLDEKNKQAVEKITSKIHYHSNDKIEGEEIYIEDRLVKKLSIKYNLNNLPIQELDCDYFSGDEIVSEYLYQYNKNDKPLLKSKTTNGKLMFEEKFHYQEDELIWFDRIDLMEDGQYKEARTSVEIKHGDS